MFIFLLLLSISIAQISIERSKLEDILIVSAIHLITLAFLVYILYSMRYGIQDRFLHIKCGFLYNKKIDIENITKIEKTSSLLSSPAASLTDRIEISYSKFNSVIISPQNRKAFLKDLLAINSSIKLDTKLKSSLF